MAKNQTPLFTKDDLRMRSHTFLACLLLGLTNNLLMAQKPVRFDGIVTAKQASALINEPTTVLLQSGLRVVDTRITRFLPDRRSRSSIGFIEYVVGSRKVRKPISDVYRMRIGDDSYAFRYHLPSKQSLLVNRSQAVEDAKRRLEESGASLRQLQGEDEIEKKLNEIRVPFDTAIKQYPNAGLAIYQSQQILLLTDYSPAEAQQLMAWLDDLCEKMNTLFGIPKTANIWNGKALVAAFSQRETLVLFEREIMKNPNLGTMTMLQHRNSRRFMAVSFRKFGEPLAKSLCWSLSSGHLANYRSTFPLPMWLHIGAHGLVSQDMFPDPEKRKRDLARIQETLAQQKSLLGLFDQTEIQNERYFICIGICRFLVEHNRAAFGQFLEDVKLGRDWEESLVLNYGITKEQLSAGFGKAIGIPDLTP